MKGRIAMLGAAAAMLSVATFSAPASAQRYYRNYNYNYNYYGRTITRCDRDGDRCATYRCDRDGDDCRRVSGWYARSHLYYGRYNRDRSYNRYRYYDRDDRSYRDRDYDRDDR